MSGLIQWGVSVVLLLAGTIKLYPISEELAKNLVDQFRVFATVYPLGYQPEAQVYLHVVGTVETLCSLGLLFASGHLQKICCGGLLFVMLGSVYTLAYLRQYGFAIAPSIFAGGLVYVYSTLSVNNGTKKKYK